MHNITIAQHSTGRRHDTPHGNRYLGIAIDCLNGIVTACYFGPLYGGMYTRTVLMRSREIAKRQVKSA